MAKMTYLCIYTKLKEVFRFCETLSVLEMLETLAQPRNKVAIKKSEKHIQFKHHDNNSLA